MKSTAPAKASLDLATVLAALGPFLEQHQRVDLAVTIQVGDTQGGPPSDAAASEPPKAGGPDYDEYPLPAGLA
jgi:hypothetical protein